MVVVSSLADDFEFCPSKVFHTPVTPHATNLLLSEITYKSFSYENTVRHEESQNNPSTYKSSWRSIIGESSRWIITEDPGSRRHRPGPARATIDIPPPSRNRVSSSRRTPRWQLSSGKVSAGQPDRWPGAGSPVGEAGQVRAPARVEVTISRGRIWG